jgi:superoxide dismutase, Cu-Zn family
MKRLVPLLAALAACNQPAPGQVEPKAPAPKKEVTSALSAVAEMYPVRRGNIHGMVRFRVTDQGVLIKGTLSPMQAGKYGFGIRQNGDCSAHDGKSAGDYFVGSKGTPQAPVGHLEDILIEKADSGDFQRVEPKLSMSGPDTIIGKSIVVEAWATDPKVDPKTVPFLACGVIRAE